MKQQYAFTLVELIVTLAIGAILLTAGMPMISSMLESNRASVRSVELRKALIATQSAATSEKVMVSLCPINSTNDGCDVGRDWANGWLMFTDPMGAGVFDAGETILHIFQATEGPHSVTGAPGFIRYRPSGDADSGVLATFNIEYPHCTNTQARQVTVSAVGRVSTTSVACR
ncbi:MAG: GspH/FimT family pseudopilin [Candidatus Polarisedimenticolaceae bacterium]|nr:GspH/FimT family pseudopilin [Candidatus Polarisedimenticolaceae bacterium]